MGIEIFKSREHIVIALTLEKIWEFSAFNEVLNIYLLISELNIRYQLKTNVLLIRKFWVYIRKLHAGIRLDFNLQCIYTIFGWITVIDKFVPLVAQVARVAEMHITIWVTSKYN